MICHDLTRTSDRFTIGCSNTPMEDRGQMGAKAARHKPLPGLVAVLLATGLGGCVTVAAPDKPIVIELNVNIKQEVVYRLAADAQNTIEQNGDVF